MHSKLKCYRFSLPIWSFYDFRCGTVGPRKLWFLWISWIFENLPRTHSPSFQERSGGQERYADAIQVSRRAVCLKRNSRAGGDLLKSWHWQACGICTQTLIQLKICEFKLIRHNFLTFVSARPIQKCIQSWNAIGLACQYDPFTIFGVAPWDPAYKTTRHRICRNWEGDLVTRVIAVFNNTFFSIRTRSFNGFFKSSDSNLQVVAFLQSSRISVVAIVCDALSVGFCVAGRHSCPGGLPRLFARSIAIVHFERSHQFRW